MGQSSGMITVDQLQREMIRKQGRQYYDEEFELDDKIVDMVAHYGYPKIFVLKSLEDKEKNHCTTCYHLLQAAFEAQKMFDKQIN